MDTVTLRRLRNAIDELPDRLPRETNPVTGDAEPVNLREFVRYHLIAYRIEV